MIPDELDDQANGSLICYQLVGGLYNISQLIMKNNMISLQPNVSYHIKLNMSIQTSIKHLNRIKPLCCKKFSPDWLCRM